MDELINILQEGSSTTQSLVVSAGGLIGVFATLGFFYVLILIADKIKKR